MNRQLLDVNMLFALVWSHHENHAAAHAWFASSGHLGWATNALTQLGVLRLLTNTTVTNGTVDATSALAVVTEATRHPGHEFRPLNRESCSNLPALARSLQGHRQWTDAVLPSHAVSRKGVLVTFDKGLEALAGREFGSRVHTLNRR